VIGNAVPVLRIAIAEQWDIPLIALGRARGGSVVESGLINQTLPNGKGLHRAADPSPLDNALHCLFEGYQ
jgi:hypothetical protein